MMELPRDALRSQVRMASPELDDAKLEDVVSAIERLRERDPLAVLHGDRLKNRANLAS
jgi:hypothetical protein